MSKKEEFINFINENILEDRWNEASDNVKIYWEALQKKEEKEKPMFTDNGKMILQFLKDNPETSSWKSRDIAEGLFISSRVVSGSIRKLVTDGYVEKIGKDPSVYAITELGKTIEII